MLMQADDRRKELIAAIKKLQRAGEEVSISAVAREVGIKPAGIHNNYSDVAKLIRKAGGKPTRQKPADQLDEIQLLKAQIKEVTKARDELRADLKKLASRAQTLEEEIKALRGQKGASGNVTPIRG